MQLALVDVEVGVFTLFESFHLWTFMKVGLVLAVVFGFLYYAGFGLANLIISERNRDKLLLLSPFTGLAFSLAIFEPLGLMGYGAKVTVWVVLLAATLVTIFSLWHRPLHFAQLRVGAGYAASTFLMVWLISSAPLFFQDSLVPIGENGDAVVYCALADYLALNGYVVPKDTDHRPSYIIVAARMSSHGRRAGDTYLLAGVSMLTGMDAFAVFSPLINLAHGLVIMGGIYLGWALFGLGARYLWLLFILLCLNATLLWGAYDDFLSQQMVIGTLLVCLSLFYELIIAWERSAAVAWREAISFSAIFSSVFSLYPESLVLFLSILSIVLVYWLLRTGSRGLRAIALCSFLPLFMNPVAIYRWVESVPAVIRNPELSTRAARMVAGNIRYFAPPHEIFGLTPHISNLVAYKESSHALLPFVAASDVLLLLSLIIIGLGIIYVQGYKRAVKLAIIFSIGVHLGAHYSSGFFYGYMKITFLGVAFLECILVASLSELWQHGLPKTGTWTRVGRGWLGLFVITSLSAHLFSVLTVIYKVTTTEQPAQSYFRELSRIASVLKPGVSIYLPNEPPSARQMWLFYFLRDQRIYVDEIIGYLGPPDSMRITTGADFVLVEKSWACDIFPNVPYCRDIRARAIPAGAVDTPSYGYMDAPLPGTTVQGVVSVDGWALDREDVSLRLVLLVDGEEVGYNPVRGEHYGVCNAFKDIPHCLNSRYRFIWNTGTVANGPHTLAVRATDSQGNTTLLGERPVTVTNSIPEWALKGSTRAIVPVLETEHFMVFSGEDLLRQAEGVSSQ